MFSALRQLPEPKKISDLTLRAGRPFSVYSDGKTRYLGQCGYTDPSHALPVYPQDVEETLRRACRYAVYSVEEELASGFLSLPGGHRLGIAGTCVLRDGKPVGVRDVSALNLRVAREWRGAADGQMPYLLQNGQAKSALVISPPGCGKTTFLRDAARQLSEAGIRVCVVDSREEIGAVCHGVPGFDLGPCCDVLSRYPKNAGIEIALRTLRPEVIVFDELGAEDQAVSEGLNCGVSFLFSAHANDLDDVRRRPLLAEMLKTGKLKTVILLDRNHRAKCLCKTEEPV